MPTFDPDSLIGRTFLKRPTESGERFRAKIIEAVRDKDQTLAKDPKMIKFRCSVNDNEYEEIVAYNEILENLERDRESEGMWLFKEIIGHQGPLRDGDPGYKKCAWNVQVAWENGEITYVPLNVFGKDDPVSVLYMPRSMVS